MSKPFPFDFSKRIYKEMKDLLTKTASLAIINNVTQLDEEGRVWCVTIEGPAGGPYEGGNFRVEIKFGKYYPREALRLKVITPIFHCNIHPQWTWWYVAGDKYEPGSVCMVSFCVIFFGLNNPTSHPKTFNQNTLDEEGQGWSMLFSVMNIFDQLAALLASPNDQDPLNFLAGKMYQDDKEEYYSHAELLTSLFAKPNSDQFRHDYTMAMALHLQQKGVQRNIDIDSFSTTEKILKHHDVQYNFDAFDRYLDELIQQEKDSSCGQMSTNESEGGSNNEADNKEAFDRYVDALFGSNNEADEEEAFDRYLDELFQQVKDSSCGQMSNNESEGGSNNEADDDEVYLGTVRPDDSSNRPRQA